MAFLTRLQRSAHASWEAVIPGCLHQHAPGVAVACLRNCPLAALGATGVLRGHQSQETHQFARSGKAVKVANLRHQRHRGDQIDAPGARNCVSPGATGISRRASSHSTKSVWRSPVSSRPSSGTLHAKSNRSRKSQPHCDPLQAGGHRAPAIFITIESTTHGSRDARAPIEGNPRNA